MDAKEDKIVQKKYVLLVETMEAQNLLCYLYQEGVLSSHDKEVISNMTTSQNQNEKLLDILKKRKDGLKMLIKALLVSGVQGFLGNELLESVPWGRETMKRLKLELKGKLDQQQMLETSMAALKQENLQLKAKNEERKNTIKELKDQQQIVQEICQLKLENEETKKTIENLTDQQQMLEANIAALKQEVRQLKATKEEKPNMTKDLCDQQQMVQEIHQLKAKNDKYQKTIKNLSEQQQVLKANMAALKQENHHLKAEKDALSKTSLKEEECHLLRRRGNAISCKGGRVLYLKLKKLETLKEEIIQLKATNLAQVERSLQEEETNETLKEEYGQMRPRLNAISL